jgi:hypothetical protein
LNIDLDDNSFVLHDDMLGEPLVVVNTFADILDRVEPAGFSPVVVSVVDLDLIALVRPAGLLILGMEVYAGVGAGFGHNVGLELEILKVGVPDRPDVEKVTAGAIDNYHTILEAESVFVLACLPAVECLAVKKVYPACCFRILLFHCLTACKKNAHTQQHWD